MLNSLPERHSTGVGCSPDKAEGQGAPRYASRCVPIARLQQCNLRTNLGPFPFSSQPALLRSERAYSENTVKRWWESRSCVGGWRYYTQPPSKICADFLVWNSRARQ
jgi:hypothetical protein